MSSRHGGKRVVPLPRDTEGKSADVEAFTHFTAVKFSVAHSTHFFLIIHIKPQARGQYLASHIMTNYRFLFISGQTRDYTFATDSEAMEAAKKYLDIRKKLHPNIRYVSVWKHVGQYHYTLVGEHEN